MLALPQIWTFRRDAKIDKAETQLPMACLNLGLIFVDLNYFVTPFCEDEALFQWVCRKMRIMRVMLCLCYGLRRYNYANIVIMQKILEFRRNFL